MAAKQKRPAGNGYYAEILRRPQQHVDEKTVIVIDSYEKLTDGEEWCRVK